MKLGMLVTIMKKQSALLAAMALLVTLGVASASQTPLVK